MNLKQLNITATICILLFFAISGNAQIMSFAEQSGDEDEAARRMGSYIKGCNGMYFSQLLCSWHIIWFIAAQIAAANADFPQDISKLHWVQRRIQRTNWIWIWDLMSKLEVSLEMQVGQIMKEKLMDSMIVSMHILQLMVVILLVRKQNVSNLKIGRAMYGVVIAQRFQKWVQHAHILAVQKAKYIMERWGLFVIKVVLLYLCNILIKFAFCSIAYL